ncbi:MAG TPA: hypothetical protein VNI36_00070 [Candidatus Dormibacteraeota bacterium]|nr:hypothetical protein [Candidatus Dormibacteraeota bacterium]
MFESAIFHNQELGTAEEKLWRAVIARTLEEWVRGPLRYSRIAEQFLFDDNRDFNAVCSSAGMNPDDLRKRLQTIRARGVLKENARLQMQGRKKLNSQTREVFSQKAYGV